ncbi:hypothetical protein ACFTSF_17550 [Kribbella sp. NPDC056951]|uniref:hypothetical protein n=1 Tax=Kribbella sp. NPDC056951 TaxID=3345978 RepID=UPI003642BE91
MEQQGVRHRPNIAFNLAGLVLIVAGIGLTIYGLVAAVGVVQSFDAFRGDGPPVHVADGMATAFWGIVVFTIGRYLWRGARTRGAADRFGRLLLVIAYVMLGIGLDGGVHAATGIWTQSSDSAEEAMIRTLVTVAVWGLPASLIGWFGTKLANEKILATAEVKVG